MRYRVLGWSDVRLRLDYRAFAYAGKFVTGLGVAAVLTDGAPTNQPDARDAPAEGVLAAVAFDPDRTEPDVLRLRYITVRRDRRGEGLGPTLAVFLAERAANRGYERLRIAVNNVFAYEATYKAGFVFTGTETGIAELVLERPAGDPIERDREDDAHVERYRDGLERFGERDLSTQEVRFLAGRRETGPPAVVGSPAR